MPEIEKVVLLDDHPEILEAMAAVCKLRLKAKQANIYEDHKKALPDAQDANIVITDLDMPEMNGIEFLEELAKLTTNGHQRITFLFTAGSVLLNNPDNRNRIIELIKQEHLSGVFIKPGELEDMVEQIKLALEQEKSPEMQEKLSDFLINELKQLYFSESEIELLKNEKILEV